MKGKTKAEQVEEYLKKQKKRCSARQVADKFGYTIGTVYRLDGWKENQKRFANEPTTDEKIDTAFHKLDAKGITNPTLEQVAGISGFCTRTVNDSPVWRERKEKKTLLKERVEHLLISVWDDPETYTAPRVAKFVQAPNQAITSTIILRHWTFGKNTETIESDKKKKLLARDRRETLHPRLKNKSDSIFPNTRK